MPGNFKPSTNNMWQTDSDEGLTDPALMIAQVGTSLATTGTVNLDMSQLNETYQIINLTGTITFTTSNREAGRYVTIKLVAGGSSRNLNFPGWTFVGAAAPTSLAANKIAIITVTFFDNTDANAVAAYAAQP